MVGALMGMLLSTALAPPVAAFSATSPALVGQTVQYRDASFDPAPGHIIVLTIWIGREASFAAPGNYAVTLDVEDDRGLWGSVTHDVLVLAQSSSAGGTSGGVGDSPVTLTCQPCTVMRGEPVTLQLAAPKGALHITLRLPAAFLLAVPLPSGVIDYRRIDSPSWRRVGPYLLARIWIPWTVRDPPDGRYRIVAVLRSGGKRMFADCTVTVRGVDRILVWSLTPP